MVGASDGDAEGCDVLGDLEGAPVGSRVVGLRDGTDDVGLAVGGVEGEPVGEHVTSQHV